MEQGFIDILQKLVAEQGKQAILDASQCKAFLSDYTRGDYKKESRLLLQAIDIGAAKAIDTVDDLVYCKKKLADRLNEEHFIAHDIAADIVDTLAFILRGDTSRNETKPMQLDTNYSQGTLTGKNDQGVSWTYTGGILNGLMHGKGKMTFASGVVYEGDWVDGKRHGKGKSSDSDGWFYEGDFSDGMPNGKGKITSPDGNIYQGDVIDFLPNGKGKETHPDGMFYVGDFVGGKRQGKGKIFKADGSVLYAGDFVNGIPA